MWWVRTLGIIGYRVIFFRLLFAGRGGPIPNPDWDLMPKKAFFRVLQKGEKKILHDLNIFEGTTHMTMKFLGRWQRRNMETEETRMRAMLASRDCAADASFRCIAVLGGHSLMTSA